MKSGFSSLLCEHLYLVSMCVAEVLFTLQGAVLLTVGRSYVVNDVTHSTLLDRVRACSCKNLAKYRSYRVSNTPAGHMIAAVADCFSTLKSSRKKSPFFVFSSDGEISLFRDLST